MWLKPWCKVSTWTQITEKAGRERGGLQRNRPGSDKSLYQKMNRRAIRGNSLTFCTLGVVMDDFITFQSVKESYSNELCLLRLFLLRSSVWREPACSFWAWVGSSLLNTPQNGVESQVIENPWVDITARIVPSSWTEEGAVRATGIMGILECDSHTLQIPASNLECQARSADSK